jgi:hypothetical protein
MKVVGVLLKSSKLFNLIDTKLGDTCDVQVGDWPSAQMRADVILVDGVANNEVMDVAKAAGARLVMSTVRKRRSISASISNWKQVGRERISHQFVGGITERVVYLSIYQPPGAAPLTLASPLAQEVPRDASTVLSLMEHAKMFRPIPTPEVFEPLACVNLGTKEKPIYHGRGLLPATLDRHTWVLTPFLYSPKAKKEWRLRRLGIQETLACLDYPEDWAKWLEKAGVDREFVERQPAMACFVGGGERWLKALFQDNGGGHKEGHVEMEPCSSYTKRSRSESSKTESPSRADEPSLYSSKIQRRRERDWKECQKHEQNETTKTEDSEEDTLLAKETLPAKDFDDKTLFKPDDVQAQPKQKAQQKPTTSRLSLSKRPSKKLTTSRLSLSKRPSKNENDEVRHQD